MAFCKAKLASQIVNGKYFGQEIHYADAAVTRAEKKSVPPCCCFHMFRQSKYHRDSGNL